MEVQLNTKTVMERIAEYSIKWQKSFRSPDNIGAGLNISARDESRGLVRVWREALVGCKDLNDMACSKVRLRGFAQDKLTTRASENAGDNLALIFNILWVVWIVTDQKSAGLVCAAPTATCGTCACRIFGSLTKVTYYFFITTDPSGHDCLLGWVVGSRGCKGSVGWFFDTVKSDSKNPRSWVF